MAIHTDRLALIPAGPRLLEAELRGREALQHELAASVPASWPPHLYDDNAIRWTLRQHASVPDFANWGMFYIVLLDGQGGTVIGTVGYKGPPDDDGVVEVGYGLLDEYQRKGYATEATRALINRAFSDDRVQEIVAETLPHLNASIAVMQRCGMVFKGDGSEAGVIRFHLPRAHYLPIP